MTLKQARDALWGEMELAKRIQTALLPQKQQTMHGFETAVAMLPAREVGGTTTTSSRPRKVTGGSPWATWRVTVWTPG